MSERTIDVARITIELKTPLAIGTGEPNTLTDAMFATDASGLPALPGTSIAGMLRSAWAELKSPPLELSRFFGFVGDKAVGADAGAASSVTFGWGRIHDSAGDLAGHRLTPDQVDRDPLLRDARVALVRQHVRLGVKGTAAARGLFSESLVAVGHRFTFEISVRDEPASALDALIALLVSPATRLGGKTRRGKGAFRVLEIRRRFFELAEGNFDDYCELSTDPTDEVVDSILPKVAVPSPSGDARCATVRLSVTPTGFWMVGGGVSTDGDVSVGPGPQHQERTPDSVPFREPRVRDVGPNKRVLDHQQPDLVIPDTAIKGTLRHRIRFHAFKRAKRFADDSDFAELTRAAIERIHDGHALTESEWGEPAAVRELLGGVTVNAKNADATPGRLLIDDVVLSETPAQKWIDHVTLDRFTSGPVDGRLFNEKPLWRGETWNMEFVLLNPDSLSESSRKALEASLDDLVSGRVGMGAGSGKGEGFLEGSWSWDRDDWNRERAAGPEGAKA